MIKKVVFLFCVFTIVNSYWCKANSKYPWYFKINKIENCWITKNTLGQGVVVELFDSTTKFVYTLSGKKFDCKNYVGDTVTNCINDQTPSNLDFLTNKECVHAIHGTAMASLVAGDYAVLKCDKDSENSCENGKVAVAGVAPGVKIMAREVVPGNNLYSALEYAFNEHKEKLNKHGESIFPNDRESRGVIVQIFNCSMGTKIDYSAEEGKKDDTGIYQDFLKRAVNESSNFLIIAAVGNDGIELIDENIKKLHIFPTTVLTTKRTKRDPIIRVGAINKYDSKENPTVYYKSNYGEIFVDIMAPGQMIPALLPSGEATILNGTSEAAAIVAGAVSLLVSCNRYLGAGAIKKILLENSDEFSSLEKKVKNGRVLNIYKAVEKCSKKYNDDFIENEL